MRLKNETAIITGSTTGIGRKLAELLLKEGCKVTICSRTEAKVKRTVSELKEQYGKSVIGFPCDVNNPKDLKKIVEKTVELFGSVRILIANAGLNTIYGSFECLTPEMVESHAKTIISTNLMGVMNSISAVLPQMNKQKYGRIITTSGGGADRPLDNMTIYSASKGGAVTFSKCLALELAAKDEDIKINIFQPGIIKTTLMSNVKYVPNRKSNQEVEENLELVLQYIGGDLEKSCSKVIPYIMPKTKSNGKVFRGFSLPKLIFNSMKLQRAMKKRKVT